VPKPKSVLRTKNKTFQDKIKQAPLVPGCYMYKNAAGKIIYVGKAKLLRNRVKSYFSNYSRVGLRIQQMVDDAVDIEFLTVDSEVEALILEVNLIQKYYPYYNVQFKDDRSYIYVKVDRFRASVDEDDWQPVPTVRIVREDKRINAANYFGPYPNVAAVRRLLSRLRKVFPYCTSRQLVLIPKERYLSFASKSGKPCFQYHIQLCPGACAGKVTRGEYEQTLRDIQKFFAGQKLDLIHSLNTEMERAARNREYEHAAQLRDRINDLKYVGQNISVDKDVDDVAIEQIKLDRRSKALGELVAQLKFPADKLAVRPGFRIECYDISNIQGTNAVGSMVVNIDGEARPDQYRRFRIQMKNEPNDFAMHQEVLTRRFNQYIQGQLSPELETRRKNWKPDESFNQLPDLIIVDGGKGQLSSTYKILQAFGLSEKVPIVGLAKREEEIFKMSEQFRPEKDMSEFDWEEFKKLSYVPISAADDFIKIRIPRKTEALYLVQRIRDEAHRFAITYHRKLRSSQAIETKLNVQDNEA
jgi:excinuclease ABC subunit C